MHLLWIQLILIFKVECCNCLKPIDFIVLIYQECVTGFEYSGKDSNGCRVMGLVTGGSMSNMVTCVRPLIWKVPNNWSLEEAATVPVVYCTVCRKILETIWNDFHTFSFYISYIKLTITLHKCT